MTTAGRAAVLRLFRWEQGHADIWRVFADADALRAVVHGLAVPWRDAGVTHVVGIESRGFLLGGATAMELGAGFVAIRKSGTGLLPGPKVQTSASPDYRGLRHDLRMQATLGSGDAALMVDDWAERAARPLPPVHWSSTAGRDGWDCRSSSTSSGKMLARRWAPWQHWCAQMSWGQPTAARARLVLQPQLW